MQNSNCPCIFPPSHIDRCTFTMQFVQKCRDSASKGFDGSEAEVAPDEAFFVFEPDS